MCRFTTALHLATAFFSSPIADQALTALLVQGRAAALPQSAALLGHRIPRLARITGATRGRAAAALHGPAFASPHIPCFSRRAGRRHYIKDGD